MVSTPFWIFYFVTLIKYLTRSFGWVPYPILNLPRGWALLYPDPLPKKNRQRVRSAFRVPPYRAHTKKQLGGLGHRFLLASKTRDPDSARRPPSFESHDQNKNGHKPFLFWCPGWDSNPHGVTTERF